METNGLSRGVPAGYYRPVQPIGAAGGRLPRADLPPTTRRAAELKKMQHGREPYISASVLLVLLLIAGGTAVKQARFDPSLFAPTSPEEGLPQSPLSSAPRDLPVPLPDGLVPMSPVETFTPETLSEKINGKAELYLSAGFRSLRSQRFMEKERSESWMELYLYDMGDLRNAFAVFTAQRREDAREVPLTPFAYETANALFFVHGRHYVEIVSAAEESPAVMAALAEGLVRQEPGREETLPELALFPSEHRVEGSWVLLAENVFGFEFMNRTFTAEYELPEGRITAFLSLRRDPEEARQLADGYVRFLLENGGKAVECADGLPGAHCITILDTLEMVFSSGRALAGVHQAEAFASATRVARSLYERIAGEAP